MLTMPGKIRKRLKRYNRGSCPFIGLYPKLIANSSIILHISYYKNILLQYFLYNTKTYVYQLLAMNQTIAKRVYQIL
jgi:hypothetical protein